MGHRANRLSLANLHALQELAAAALPPAPLPRQQLLDRHAVELPPGRHDHFSRAQLSRRNPPLQLGACLAHQVRLSEGLAALLEPSADITRIQGNRPHLREQQPTLPSHAQAPRQERRSSDQIPEGPPAPPALNPSCPQTRVRLPANLRPARPGVNAQGTQFSTIEAHVPSNSHRSTEEPPSPGPLA